MRQTDMAYQTMMEQQRGALCALLNGTFGPRQWRISECPATGNFVVEAELLQPAKGFEGEKFRFSAPPGPDCVKILRVKLHLIGAK